MEAMLNNLISHGILAAQRYQTTTTSTREFTDCGHSTTAQFVAQNFKLFVLLIINIKFVQIYRDVTIFHHLVAKQSTLRNLITTSYNVEEKVEDGICEEYVHQTIN